MNREEKKEMVMKHFLPLKLQMIPLVGKEAVVISKINNTNILVYLPPQWKKIQFIAIVKQVSEMAIDNGELPDINVYSIEDFINKQSDKIAAQKEIDEVRNKYIKLYMNIDGAV